MIEKVRGSTNEVGGRLLDLGGAEYMIRGLGYLRSLNDLADVPVATKNGTPVLIRDLGTVSFGPDIREGVAEWQGEGETVGGICGNALRNECPDRDQWRQAEAGGNQAIPAARR
ncbi:MAG: hypothetical protein ACRD4S_03095 [Candidatus Acidiferrales bacterium]